MNKYYALLLLVFFGVINAFNAKASKEVGASISKPKKFKVIAKQTKTAKCNGDANGTATAYPRKGKGHITYKWSDNTTGATLTARVGNYTVIATDSHNDTAMARVVITQPTAITVNANQLSSPNCNGGIGTATAVGHGGTSHITYKWSNLDNTTGATLSAVAGIYTITATDNLGCTATASAEITQPTTLIVSASRSNAPKCNGDKGTATISTSGGTGNIKYTWNNGSIGATLSAVAGIYTVTATDMNGCTASANVTITQPSEVTVAASLSVTPTSKDATDGEATATSGGGTGTISLIWNNASSTTGATLTAGPGTYIVTATDANSCTATASVIIPCPITIPPCPIFVEIISQTNITCYGGKNGSVIIRISCGTVTTHYKYIWNNEGASTTKSEFIKSNLSAGTYTITVFDTNDNIASRTVTITQPDPLNKTITPRHVTSFGGSDGNANAIQIEGYTYLWSNGVTNSSISNLSAGTYTIKITDVEGCNVTASVSITQPSAPILSISKLEKRDVTYYDKSNGTATVTASSECSRITYSWTNNGSSSSTTGLSAGTYTVYVSDACGNKAKASITITQPNNAAETELYNQSDFFRRSSPQLADFRGWATNPSMLFYMEGRYGYEAIYTGSLFIGFNFMKLQCISHCKLLKMFDIVIMGGGVSGQLNGFAWAIKFRINNDDVGFKFEDDLEHVYSTDTNHQAGLIYNWSKLTYSFGRSKDKRDKPFGIGIGMQLQYTGNPYYKFSVFPLSHPGLYHENLYYLGPMIRVQLIKKVMFADLFDYYSWFNKSQVYTLALDIDITKENKKHGR